MEFIIYTDFKSPYAYLAKEFLYQLEDESGVYADWRHYTLDIPSYLGSATLDSGGKVIQSDRSEHQWRKIKYAYMDVRRRATVRGMTIRGTTKIWDTVPAATAFYFAKDQGRDIHRKFMDITFEPFWKRELDIENYTVLEQTLKRAGADTTGFIDYAQTQGREIHDELRSNAEQKGVFGVPSIILNDELFFGREQFPILKWKLTNPDDQVPNSYF